MLTATLALGFPSATDAFIQHFVKDKCLAIIEDVDKLDNIPDGFIHYQLIRFCQATRLQYLNGHVQIANQNVLHEEDDTGVRGGVERGMLSTTTHKKVAIFYLAGRKLPSCGARQGKAGARRFGTSARRFGASAKAGTL